MLKSLIITGDNESQVKTFACCLLKSKALDKLYLPDFNVTVKLTDGKWHNVEFLLEIPSGLPYSAKEFLKIQFEIWAKKELFGDLYKFFIYSKYSEDITKIKFRVNLWD